MGSLPRLKLKDQYRYRKGSTNEAENCKNCENFVKDFDVKGIGGGGSIGWECRCKLFGLKGSRRYRIHEDYRCDMQVMSAAYKKQMEAYEKTLRIGSMEKCQEAISE